VEHQPVYQERQHADRKAQLVIPQEFVDRSIALLSSVGPYYDARGALRCPTHGSVMRRALELGLGMLERQHGVR
jgi:hypothetical protein